jgi:hypothetical protein
VARIETEEAARRLARAIVADIRLYHQEAVASGADLTEEIGEGRALFQSRVEPSLHGVYEHTLEEVGLATAGTLAPLERGAPPLAPGLFESPPAPATSVPWPLIGAFLIVALGVGYWLASR